MKNEVKTFNHFFKRLGNPLESEEPWLKSGGSLQASDSLSESIAEKPTKSSKAIDLSEIMGIQEKDGLISLQQSEEKTRD